METEACLWIARALVISTSNSLTQNFTMSFQQTKISDGLAGRECTLDDILRTAIVGVSCTKRFRHRLVNSSTIAAVALLEDSICVSAISSATVRQLSAYNSNRNTCSETGWQKLALNELRICQAGFTFSRNPIFSPQSRSLLIRGVCFRFT